MWHAWERRENCTRFWRESLKERDHLKDHGIDERMEFKLVLGKVGVQGWSGFRWLRIGTDVGLL
jgi:hypothetical protein